MDDRELMQQALDALEYASDQTKPENLHGCDCLLCKTILALRERLAPQERQWVGLTDEEIDGVHNKLKTWFMGTYNIRNIYQALEAKLKEKNGG